MASLNKPFQPSEFTHEGAPAKEFTTPIQQLRRAVLSCLLWEDEFYENGISISQRIIELCKSVPVSVLSATAVEARTKFNLRHVPLLLLSVLCDVSKGNSLVSETIPQVIQRADELTEFLAVFAAYKEVKPSEIKKVMTHGMRKGLAAAFTKFDAYSLAKYNRDNLIKLKDVLFLTHPKPKNDEQKQVWEKLINGTLESPDTWEVELSAGKDKKETFERFLKENKLGYLALLRNLRNMVSCDVDSKLVSEAILARKNGADRVLPFRFVAAARYAPQYEPELDESLRSCIKSLPELKGTTLVLVDVSGSMNHPLSGKSDMTRIDAAATLASVINGHCRVLTFSNYVTEVPPRKGMTGVDAIKKSQPHSGTRLGQALKEITLIKRDRLIVITDEQSKDVVIPPHDKLKYMINVASYKNGIGYGDGWVHIDGFSENVIRYVVELENGDKDV